VSLDDADTVTQEFSRRHGHEPAGVWRAPGRVNLIGEHTDYNDGFVMPFALAQAVTIAAAPRDDDRWSVTSLNNGETQEFGRPDLEPGMSGWQAYVAGVVWALTEAGHAVGGADLVLTSDVPVGAGLSSSAALECATLTVLADLGALSIEPLERAKLARRCENEFVGAPTGLMDQAASTLCTEGHALFFDCRSFAAEQVPLDLAKAGLELLVLDTQTPHALVDSEYAERRKTCALAAKQLGVRALRDIPFENLDNALAGLGDELMRRRVRHVVTEDQRVLDTVARLETRNDLRRIGPFLTASHISMRDDFNITVPQVDLAVVAALDAGAFGARMTGGGFGGSVVALVDADQAAGVFHAAQAAYTAAGYLAPVGFTATASTGAHRL
jgi:galactokinase